MLAPLEHCQGATFMGATSPASILVYQKLDSIKFLAIMTQIFRINTKIIIILCETMQSNQIHAVALGFPVTYSSVYKSHDCMIPRLDAKNFAWSPDTNDITEWIQVSSLKPQLWVAVITQGRASWDQWVSEYRVQHSMNGVDWYNVDEARIFYANNDRNTKVRNDFKQGVQARSIRILPLSWNKHISMRFDAIFIEA